MQRRAHAHRSPRSHSCKAVTKPVNAARVNLDYPSGRSLRSRGRSGILHALFVCTGNICRSPTAERLAMALSARLGIENFSASSAGTRAVTAHPIHHEAALVLERLGGDPSDFAARQFMPRMAEEADIILAMTRHHRDTVLSLAPGVFRKTFTLRESSRLVSEFKAESIRDLADLRSYIGAGSVSDIPDPIGREPKVFEAVGSQIADLLPPIIEQLGRWSRG